MYHSTYFGVSIYRNTKPGYSLRWYTLGMGADTLSGIRELIRKYHKPAR